MWNEIKTSEELKQFLDNVNYFHDGVVKEIRYVSGAYEDCDMNALYPINDKRLLRMIIVGGYPHKHAIELEFGEISYLKLNPVDDDYTCVIFGVSMFFHDGLIYWVDDDYISIDQINEYRGTIICGKTFRWHHLDNVKGKDEVYGNCKD